MALIEINDYCDGLLARFSSSSAFFLDIFYSLTFCLFRAADYAGHSADFE